MLPAGLLKRLCAIAVVTLVLCPFTAPFQTCDLVNGARGSLAAPGMGAPIATRASFDDHAGSLVGLPSRVADLGARGTRSGVQSHLFAPLAKELTHAVAFDACSAGPPSSPLRI